MSPTDGDAASRLESALADVFAGAPALPSRDQDINDRPASPPPSDDWDVDGPDDGPVPIPKIVPATTHPPTAPVHSRVAPAAPAPPASAPRAAAGSPPVTSWGDHMTNLPANAQGAALRAPGRRPRVRRVTRVLRHIDPWSTFKVGLLFSVVAYLVTLTSGVLLWRVADSTGTLDNVERWFTQFGWETFELKGGQIFHDAWIIGLFGVVALTGGLVLLATLWLTAGTLLARFEKDHDDYSSIILKALADRLAEAFAEYMHARVRREFWGYEPDEDLSNNELIAEKYRGIRPAPGYPACPDHTEKATLWTLLDVEAGIGLKLTESFAMYPTAAVSGFYLAHPDARYFAVGKVDRDQLASYAERKGISLVEAERWLAPNLGYDPDEANAA